MLAWVLVALAGLISLSTAGYVLEDDYSPQNFFSMFDFFTVCLSLTPFLVRPLRILTSVEIGLRSHKRICGLCGSEHGSTKRPRQHEQRSRIYGRRLEQCRLRLKPRPAQRPNYEQEVIQPRSNHTGPVAYARRDLWHMAGLLDCGT